jgi:phosphatidylglycerophosphate synthase
MTRSRATERTRHRAARPREEPRPAKPVAPAASGLVTKGDEVEEWLDLRFFRPIGARIARRFAPTRITADQVTLLSLIIGLVAGRLFFYTSPWLNALGFVLFIISDLFDSADGQLARMRGTSTQFGRALDGVSDGLRFLNLGLNILARLVLTAGWSWPAATALVAVAAVSHSTQSAAIDFVRHAYLALAVGRGSELQIDGPTVTPTGGTWAQRLAVRIYQRYSRAQARMFPCTVSLLRAQRAQQLAASVSPLYRARVAAVVRQCAWLGQNFRFITLGVTAVAGWPAGLLWVTAVPMNVFLVWLLRAQERAAGRVLHVAEVSGPAPLAPPARAIRGE